MPRPWAHRRRQPQCLPSRRQPQRQEPPPHPQRRAGTAVAEAEEVAGRPQLPPQEAPAPTPK
eukprot:14883820-Alexandrium_andersonii.AAC.1